MLINKRMQRFFEFFINSVSINNYERQMASELCESECDLFYNNDEATFYNVSANEYFKLVSTIYTSSR